MSDNHNTLNKYLSPLNVWALSFGCIVGWASFVMPGTTFLPLAGPLGTALGMAVGACLMLIISTNYYFLMNRYPEAGGAFTYTNKIFGCDHGFLSAWFLVITYIALIWSNSTAIALIGRRIFNNSFSFGFHYQIFDYDVYLTEVAMSIMAVLIFAVICIFKKLAAKLVTAMALLMLFAVIFTFSQSLTTVTFDIFNPPFAVNVNPINQILSIVTFAPFAFVGFEAISNSAQEFNFSPKKTFILMTSAIFSGFIFYTVLTELAVTAAADDYYNWRFYIADLPYLRGLGSLPTVSAAFKALSLSGLYLISVAILCTLTTSLIGFFTAASRLICSMSEDRILPQWFGRIDNGTPRNAIIALAAISIFVPFLGRTAIDWCVDITSLGAAIAYGYTSTAAYKLAKSEGLIKIEITGLVGILMSFIFGLFLLVPNLLSFSSMAAESYFIMVVWSILGFIFFRRLLNFDSEKRFGKSVVVWIVMLFFIFFGSVMWMRQSNNESMEAVVHNIGNFYSNELKEEGLANNKYRQEREEKYLKAQMDNIRASLQDHSVIQMTLIMISLGIIFNIYSILRHREERAEFDKIHAEESSKAKTLFLSNMSHDIRTPMNAIIGYVHLAQREGVSASEAQDFLKKIEVSSQHLLNLINDVLEMSRIESGKMELEPVDTDLVKTVEEVGDMFATQMQGKNIDFKLESNVKNKFVLCDKNRLNRVLLNLLSNAYKFTPKGGNIRVTLNQISETDSHGTYELRVKDNGIGMSTEFAETIFEAFTREKTSTVSGIQGTGLGMSITKSIVDLMGGEIKVITAPNEGTEFIINVTFELQPKLEIEEVESSESTINDDVDFSKKKLLLVDDIEVNREIAVMILMQVGFNVDTAANGQEALDKIAASKPGDYDAVLMDIQMPIMNGYESAQAIRKLSNPKLANIPIVAMTANAFNEDIQAAKEAGMNDHISKPIDVNKMIETLKKILA